MNTRINELLDAIEAMGADGALITSRQNVFYLSGFTGSAGFLFITRSRACLYTDFRYKTQAALEASGYDLVVESNPYSALSRQACDDGVKVVAVEDRDLTLFSYGKFKEAVKAETVGMGDLLLKLRQQKSADELARINEAVRLADAAFDHAVKNIREGMTEIAVAAMIEGFMRENGAQKPSFDTICASGARGALPHGTATSKTLNRGELLVLDFGCILDGYCSDITRTVSIGPADLKAKEIYNIVLYAGERAQKSIAPGMSAKELDGVARDIIKSFGYGENFGHSLGHGVGVEIHERPTVGPSSEDFILQGSVFTIEPGIYIEGLLGVRIEDVVYVDGQGYTVLTKAPKELIEII